MLDYFNIASAVMNFSQVMKRIAIRLFRIRLKEVVANDILDHLIKEGYGVSSFSYKMFKVRNSTHGLNDFYLRKNTSDLFVFNQVILQEEYKLLIDLIQVSSSTIKYIIDAGANVGLTSLYLHHAFPQSKICAIEPDPGNFSALETNISGIGDNRIVAIQKALWPEKTKMKITSAFRDRLEWSAQVSSDPSGDIETITLSEIAAHAGFEQIDILKIDIEGAEAALFNSESFITELQNVRFIAIELHEEAVDKIHVINQLQLLGFKLTYKGETLFGVNEKPYDQG